MTARGAVWTADTQVEARVEALLQQLTLEQKVELVSGKVAVPSDPWGEPPPPSPVPPFSLSDGPAGVRIADRNIHGGRATALPAPIALAATWSPELARQYGDLLGAETAAHGHNVLLGPAVDIVRAPLAGRTFESFGEDPLLQARMIVPEVEAIQSHSVQACLKHYIVNNQEYQRSVIDVRVGERAMQEVYLPPFAAAVQEGHVASIMGSYNRINGTYACENPQTLKAVLREQLGFRGWVMSDFLANHSTVESANAGLDWELTMRGLWGPHLIEAVQAGTLEGPTLDEMVRRILRPTVGLGLLDHPIEVRPVPMQRHGEQARAIAEQGIVLLKNAGGPLPLATDRLRSIAVIGPDADNVSAAGGGSGLVQPAYGVSVLEAIRDRAGAGARVEYAPGADPIGAGVLLPGPPAVPSTVLLPADGEAGEHGLRAEYWTNLDFAGAPSLVRTELRAELNRGFAGFPGVDASSPKLAPVPAELPARFSARWTGRFTAPATGDYTLSLTSLGSARLVLDDQALIELATTAPAAPADPPDPVRVPFLGVAVSAARVATATVPLVAGEEHAVAIEYAADAPGQSFLKEAMVRFGWQPPQDVATPAIADAAALARQSDVAIVVARTFESEEIDRPNLRLPNEQDVLIRAVAAANPRTVVVLMSGGPVETASWEAAVPAILEAWYGGQEQGNAVARVLFGDVNPAGRLPLTFPRGEDRTPVATPAQYPGVDGAVHYTEGVFVGYRGYDQLDIEPQYPFGHGLTYTSFAYGDLQLSADAITSDERLAASVDITNTGQRAGQEVVQLYLRDVTASVERPPKELKGFARVALEPGETKTVTLAIDRTALAYWDETRHAWVAEAGEFEALVGASSRDIRARATFQLTDTTVVGAS